MAVITAMASPPTLTPELKCPKGEIAESLSASPGTVENLATEKEFETHRTGPPEEEANVKRSS